MTERPSYLFEKFTAEHVILIGLVLVSAYMFAESYTFREPSGLFPRFVAGITILGAVMLLLKSYLPKPLRALTTQSADVFESYEEEFEEVSGDSTDVGAADGARRPTGDERGENDGGIIQELLENKRLILAILTGGYIVASYLVGFLLASPLFVLGYSLFVGHDRWITVSLTAGAFGIVYAFMLVLTVPLNSGALLG